MHVFLTGGTGYIGSAVARHLLQHRHQVTVLARPGSDSASLESLGASVLRGELAGLPELRSKIESHDAFIHAAMSGGTDASDNDRTAIEVFGAMPRGVFVYTSGVWVFGNTGHSQITEDSPVNPLPIVAWRPAHEELVVSASSSDLRTAVLRPGCVYGARQSLLSGWFSAIEKGEPVQLVGDGQNRWSMIEIQDLAACYGLILESGEDGIFHATDDTDDSLQTLAEATIGAARSNVGIEYVPLEKARETMGAFADALAVDQRVGSDRTRARLGWTLAVPEYIDSVRRQWSEWRAR
ncbi:MAG TPA: NAD-dependent epimerase/dehydratase family protein [Thermoanaerobaculia bacterium]|nr:NAD-dependent epimerase/dehydratase family protein [Thermoanaerobaculia bacterium]